MGTHLIFFNYNNKTLNVFVLNKKNFNIVLILPNLYVLEKFKLIEV